MTVYLGFCHIETYVIHAKDVPNFCLFIFKQTNLPLSHLSPTAHNCHCNCNYILFTKLLWPGDSEETFRFSSQTATCPPVYDTRWRLHTVPLIAERQASKLRIPILIVLGLARPRIELASTALVVDALSTRPLIS